MNASPDAADAARAGSPPNAAPRSSFPKQAVVIIHGMGEQMPMDTIKSFVRAVWEEDRSLWRPDIDNPGEVWSRPDNRTGSLELRRITTRESKQSPPEFPDGVRTDFYELYWADLTAGETWEDFTAWVRGLLFRRLKRVPRGLGAAWVLLWAASIIVVLLGLGAIMPGSVWQCLGWPGAASWQWLIGAAALALTAGLHNIATKS